MVESTKVHKQVSNPSDAVKTQIAKNDSSEKIIELAKKRGFFYISNEIYGGIAGFYDYGTTGTCLRRTLKTPGASIS